MNVSKGGLSAMKGEAGRQVNTTLLSIKSLHPSNCLIRLKITGKRAKARERKINRHNHHILKFTKTLLTGELM